MKNLIFYPMAASVLHIFVLIVLNLFTRVRAIMKGEVSPEYYKTFSQGSPTEKVIKVGRNFDNQFQMPVLFFITCLCIVVLSKVDTVYLWLAWSFVAARIVHSYIHIGTNNVIHRLIAFSLASVFLLIMWIILFVQVLTQPEKKGIFDSIFN